MKKQIIIALYLLVIGDTSPSFSFNMYQNMDDRDHLDDDKWGDCLE